MRHRRGAGGGRRPLPRIVASLLLAAVLGGLVALVPPAPASAHSVGGVGATNFRTTLTELSPAVAGVQLSVVENGSRLQLRNQTGTAVVVRGYDGEPYARVGAGGVFVNDNSPATYLNANRYAGTPVPDRADPEQPPAWRKVSDDAVFRWHDHRIHWMLQKLPPPVAADPSAYHRVSTWAVTLEHGDRTLTAAGTLDWVPGPSPWPWLLLAGLLAALVVAAGLLRGPHRWLAVATGLLLVADVVHALGIAFLAGSPTTRPGPFVASIGTQLLVWPFAVAAVVLLARRRGGGIWLAGLAGVSIALISGVPDLPALWRSSAPSVLPLAVDRAGVVVAFGVGFALLAALVLILGRERRQATAGSVPRAEGGGPRVEGGGPRVEGGGPRVEGGEPSGAGQHGAEPEPAPPGGDTVPPAGVPPAGLSPAGLSPADPPSGVSRRSVVGYATAGGLGGLAGMSVAVLARPAASRAPDAPATAALGDVGARVVPFHGDRQAGIATPARQQAHARIAAYDVLPGTDPAALRGLLRGWTAAAATLTAGRPLGGGDTATRDGGPAALTITVGFGPSLFGRAGVPVAARPAALAPLPAFPGERLDPARSDGDLGLLVCADDPAVVFHAMRALHRLAAGTARLRWQMSGFSRARGAAAEEATPRNLMGQIDGTNNPSPADPDFDAKVFIPANAEPAWLRGGSYLVVRRIRMLLDSWDALDVTAQEKVIGRHKDSGAPLSGGGEHTPADFGARGGDRSLLIPADAHIRLAAPAFNQGATMLRRGYSFADGTAPDGGPDAGLIFLAWQADPRRGFIPVQQRLARVDALSRFVRHQTSALFAMPGGAVEGAYLGQPLWES